MKYLIIIVLFFNIAKSYGQVVDTLQKTIAKKILTIMPKENLNKYLNNYLPKFSLPDIEGEFIDSKTLKGKPTLINFWFTNCAPCIKKIPMLNEIKKEFGDRVNFIAITYEKSDEIKAFLKLREFDFQHLVNSENYLEQFGTFGYPKSIILDKEFKVIKIEKIIIADQDKKIDTEAQSKNRIINLLKTLL